MAKSPDAFRTISEVADWLGIQAHVLRFWESKFTQVKPIKRAGGRRYYRPADMLLLGGIKKLLHDDGLTIKGVQKILREEGMNHVADMSAPLDELTLSQFGDAKPAAPQKPETAVVAPEEEKGVVLSFESAAASKPVEDTPQEPEIKEEPVDSVEATAQDKTPEAPTKKPVSDEPEPQSDPQDAVPEVAADQAQPDEKTAPEPPAVPSDPVAEPSSAPAQAAPEKPADVARATDPEPIKEKAGKPASKDAEEPVPVAALPAFLRRPLADQGVAAAEPDAPAEQDREEATAAPEPAAPAAKKPRVIDLPAFTAEADFPASPAVLTAAFRARKIAPAHAAKASTLLRQLTALRDSMAARRRGATPPPSQD